MFTTLAQIATGVLIGYFGIPYFQKSGITDYMNQKIGEYQHERAERLRKEKEAFDLYNEREEEYKTSFITELSNNFIQKTEFCRDELISEYKKKKKKIYNLINNLNKSEKFENIFNNRISQILTDLSTKMSKMKMEHLNILLVGPTGVGKSFLINTILQLDENKKAKTKASKPTTKMFQKYESKKTPNIRLIDSRGLEKGNYNTEIFVKEITDYIEQQELKGNPDEFIHCIWYCVTGTRFEDVEEEILFKLSAIYDDSTLPIMVVYTQAMVPEYYNAIEKEIHKIKKDIEYIPVVAKDIKISDEQYVKSKNLDTLLLKSVEKSKNAVYSSVFSSLKIKIFNETIKNIDQNHEKNMNNLKKYTHYSGNISEMEEFDMEKEFNKIIKNNIFGIKNKNNFNSESQTFIKTFAEQIQKKNKNIFEQCLDNFVAKNAKIMAEELNDIQIQVNQMKEGHFRAVKTKKQLIKKVTPDIKNSIKQDAHNFAYLNYIKILPEKLSLIFSDKIKNHFKYLITETSTKNVIHSKIKERFQKILSSIKNIIFKN